MPLSRAELEEREFKTLAKYAQFSAHTRGRQYPEPPPDWRTHYQRDRDRVIHSRAFRRLEYKTQVFLNGTGDHLRTRLTHSIEVAAISRNITRALQLNEDLAETIALAHDLGHPPFGHKGEAALNRLLQNYGGFEHNRQSLRIVEELEQKYPGFPGLNLTWEVREGLAKHSTSFDLPEKKGDFNSRYPSLEAQVADLADEITYYSHDLDDGLESGLLNEEQLIKEVEIWQQAHHKVLSEYGHLHQECRWYFIIRCIIDSQIRDVVKTSEQRIKDSFIKSADEARAYSEPLVQYSTERQRMNSQLCEFLYKNLYNNPQVQEPNQKAVKMLEELFYFYLENIHELGEQSRRRLETVEIHRVVCDYIAGMTDRYVLQEYNRLIRKNC
jgi:dGTPase